MTKPRPARVLMVCTGNICRSTMAHAVLEQAAARAGVDVVVDSAGVSDEEAGNPIDRRAARVLRDAGYAVPDHPSRQIRAGVLGEWDLMLAMTSRHGQSGQINVGKFWGVTIRDGCDGIFATM